MQLNGMLEKIWEVKTMANNTVNKLANRINTLLVQKEKKSKEASKINDEIKKIDADIKELNALKTDLEKIEAKAAEKLG